MNTTTTTEVDLDATTTQSMLFGPLGKKYCLYFYALMIFFMGWLGVFVIAFLYVGISKKKGIDFYINSLGMTVLFASAYIQNRLLYHMCTGGTGLV
jgi:hypothetical protein